MAGDLRYWGIGCRGWSGLWEGLLLCHTGFDCVLESAPNAGNPARKPESAGRPKVALQSSHSTRNSRLGPGRIVAIAIMSTIMVMKMMLTLITNMINIPISLSP